MCDREVRFLPQNDGNIETVRMSDLPSFCLWSSCPAIPRDSPNAGHYQELDHKEGNLQGAIRKKRKKERSLSDGALVDWPAIKTKTSLRSNSVPVVHSQGHYLPGNSRKAQLFISALMWRRSHWPWVNLMRAEFPSFLELNSTAREKDIVKEVRRSSSPGNHSRVTQPLTHTREWRRLPDHP